MALQLIAGWRRDTRQQQQAAAEKSRFLRRACGRHMSHGSVQRCWIAPPTLNGNASLGQRSMVLHMELQHAHRCARARGHASRVYV